jgi:hypothetical protein
MKYGYKNKRRKKMGKGSGRRPSTVDEDDYGNELPSNMADKEKPPKPHKPRDPDRFIDETGDA